MTAKLKRISISGVRTLDDFNLDLDGLTVLIGENGSGKSSIVEAFELLRRLTSQNFFQEFNQIHGGESMLLRHGADEIEIGAGIDGGAWSANYEAHFGKSGVTFESLWITPGNDPSRRVQVIERVGKNVNVDRLDGELDIPANQGGFGGGGFGGGFSPVRKSSEISVDQRSAIIGLNGFSHPEPLVAEISQAIRSIDTQLSFSAAAFWATRSQGAQVSPMRDAVTVAPTERLERFGSNLANAFFALRNGSDASWRYTMELVRLGLGHWIESVNVRPDAGGGRVGLWVKIATVDKEIPASSLSDGQLSYLAFVALAQLPTDRSILVFDELETHLHPRLLTRVLALMQTVAEKTPVLITTHSRRLLDELDEPAKSVGVLELEPESLKTRLRRLDEDALNSWLEDYDGLGQLLDAGYQESFLAKPTSSEER